MKDSNDLTEQKVWSDIARAYEKVIVRTSFYESMISDLSTHVRGNAVVDLGCGIGYLMNMLLEIPDRKTVGVDTNSYMLDIAKREIIRSEFLDRVELFHADAVTFASNSPFDAVVSSNVLFNLSCPDNFLNNTHHLLSQGGRVVLASPHHEFDLDYLFEATLGDLQKRGLLTEERMRYANVVKQVNERFMGKLATGEKKYTTFDNNEIEQLLLKTGYSRIVFSGRTYLGQNFLVVAEK